jgi:hypothetical protein
MKQKLVRFNSKLNTNNIKKKTMFVGKVNGKELHADYMVIENVCHMLSGSVMNGLLYGDEVFNKLASDLMKSNARIPAPMSHPSDSNGNFVDANDPITFPAHNVGAYDTDWSISGDKLLSNTYIPVESVDNPKDGNQWLSGRINNQQPIDRSTGLFLSVNDSTGYGRDGDPYNGEVTEIYELNHSAILNPDIEPGAKDSGSGVGMFTNAQGDKVNIEECELSANASTPAMKLPLANNDYVFNADQALERVKNYTNSTDKPSTSYRKFFLNFDQDNADSFDSYTNLFADIIDNVPHAIKSQVANTESEHAKAYVDRFDSEMQGNKQSFVKKMLNKIFGKIASNELSHDETRGKIHDKLNEGRGNDSHYHYPHDIFSTYFVYCGDNDKLYKQAYAMVDDNVAFIGEKVEVEREVEYKPITNTTESVMDKAELIALLTANGIEADADMTDEELKAKLKKNMDGKSKEKLDEVANAANADAISYCNS